MAEDEPTIGEMISMLLEERGYDVRLTRDGVECLRLLEDAHHTAAALLLDLGLPRLGGAEVLRRLRGFAPELPVIVMSGDQSPATMAALTSQPAVSLLAKPFGGSALRSSLALAVSASR
ncbi:MAG: response regulator [Gemmatimonadetes bacterium]|nr:response regulator [Gemmatimonadota bacterium]